jgi:hypothetical protein
MMRPAVLARKAFTLVAMLAIVGGCGPTASDAVRQDDAALMARFLKDERVAHKRGIKGATLLHLAANDDSRQCAALLLAAGADVDARDADGRTPLHLAVFRAHREMAALLLENGADIWVEDLRGRTPFHLARISADTTLLALMVPPEVLRPGSAADRPAAAEWFARGHSLAVVGNYPQAIQAIDPQAAAALGAPRP